MPRQKGVSQLETLRRKQAELAEQLKAAEAREREREKQTEAKRQEIIGTLIADYLRSEPDSALARSVIELLGRKLTRAADRALFPYLPLIAPSREPPLPAALAANDAAEVHAAPA